MVLSIVNDTIEEQGGGDEEEDRTKGVVESEDDEKTDTDDDDGNAEEQEQGKEEEEQGKEEEDEQGEEDAEEEEDLEGHSDEVTIKVADEVHQSKNVTEPFDGPSFNLRLTLSPPDKEKEKDVEGAKKPCSLVNTIRPLLEPKMCRYYVGLEETHREVIDTFFKIADSR
ncbi:hypothetical protein IFM89_000430 [Coptis chinensis]|uniref:Uncharacterized protein n=1 Tax=Coptis chinensis TaxID=261450 RepID=A0A835IAW2_9MAGN|nr:hypothetical protein IFM89_000430 [Coptis chinensis]